MNDRNRVALSALCLSILLMVVSGAPAMASGQDPLSTDLEADTTASFTEESEDSFPYLDTYSQSITTGGSPGLMTVGDFNNDSLKDIAVGSQSEDRVEIYFQETDGSFNKTPFLISLPGSPTGMDTGDLDGDGLDDIVISVTEDEDGRVYMAFQGLEFEKESRDTFSNPYGIFVQDFGGNDDIDDFVVVGHDPGCTYTVHLSGPEYDFGYKKALDVNNSKSSEMIHSDDFDGDGYPDLVFGDQEDGKIQIYRNLMGDTGKIEWEHYQGIDFDVSEVFFSQYDGVGSPELVAMSSSLEKVRVWKFDGNAFNIEVSKGVQEPSSISLSDLDGDSIQDMLSLSEGEHRTQVFPGSEYGFSNEALWEFPIHQYVLDSVMADIDGDGREDLLVAQGSPGNGTITIYYQEDRGGSGYMSNADRNLVVDPMASEPLLGDFDGDGEMEIGVPSGTGSISFLNESGEIDGSLDLPTGDHRFKVGDLGGDGDDLVLSGSDDGDLRIYRGGPGFYGSAPESVGTDVLNATGIDVADISGNGLKDIVLGGADGIQILFNENSSFDANRSFLIDNAGGPFDRIECGHLNWGWEGSGTHLVDIATLNSTLDGIELYLQNEEGDPFDPDPSMTLMPPGGGAIAGLETSRLTDDPFHHLVSAREDGTLTVFVQKEGFELGFEEDVNETIALPHNITDISVGDLNDDGTEEIVAMGEGEGTVIAYDSGLRIVHNLTAGAGPSKALVGDLNGDSRKDLLFSSALSSTVSILYQNNLPPRAEAECLNGGGIQEGDEITLSGENSTDSFSDRDSLTYQWDLGDENHSQGAQVEHTYMDDGNYTVTLTVTDRGGLSDTTTLQVNLSDRSPTAHFTAPSSAEEGEEIQFVDNSTSYPDRIVSREWDFGNENWTDIQGDEDPDVTHTYTDDGNYTVTLTVEDDDGSQSTHSWTIDIQDRAPVASFEASAHSILEGGTVTFVDNSYSDPDEIENWTWDFGDGHSGYGKDVEHRFMSDGDYTVTLTVEDEDGSLDNATANITVVNVDPEVDFAFSPEQPDEGERVNFTDASTGLHEIAEWHWDFGDGNVSDEEDPSHVYHSDGLYTVTLTVVDSDGDSNSTQVEIAIQDTLRTDFEVRGDLEEGSPIEFLDRSGSYHPITDWSWDFGDGNHSEESGPIHVYGDDGTYEVTLNVTDEDGSTDRLTMNLSVNDTSPVIERFYTSPDADAFDEGQRISFRVNASETGDRIREYEWDFSLSGGFQADNSTEDGTVTHRYSQSGIHTVAVRVWDRDSYNEQSIRVEIENLPPVAALSFHNTSNGAVFFDASQSEDTPGDQSELIYKWNFNDGGGWITTDQPFQEKRFSNDGEYQVQLIVEDDDGDQDGTSVTVTVDRFQISVGEEESSLSYLVAGLVGSGIAVMGTFLYVKRRFAVDDVFVIYQDGCLISHETRRLKPGMDNEVLSSMLVALQDFVRDSFKDEEVTTLKRLDFGDKTIAVEKGHYLYLAAVVQGNGGDRIQEKMTKVLKEMEGTYESNLADWDGGLEELRGIKEKSRDLFTLPVLRGTEERFPLKNLVKMDLLKRLTRENKDNEGR